MVLLESQGAADAVPQGETLDPELWHAFATHAVAARTVTVNA